MKKMNKLVMAAILAVALQGTAMAVGFTGPVDLNATTPGYPKYANELITANDVNLGTVNGTTNFDVRSKLGFGVSATQTRFMRFDLTGVKFNETLRQGISTNDGSLLGLNCTSVISSVTPTYVIFQITANQNLAENDPFILDLNSLLVTDKGNAAVIKYSLYEQAWQAQQAGETGRLYSNSGILANFAPGFVFTTTPNTTTAAVIHQYLKFEGDTDTAAIGNFSFGIDPDVLNRTSGAVTLTNLISSTAGANKLKVITDNSVTNVKKIWRSASESCAAGTDATTPYGTNFVEIPLDGVSETVNGTICYQTNGTGTIAVQDFTVNADITAASNTLTNDVNGKSLGNFIHDGTVLRAPFIQGQAGQSSFIQLANMGTLNAEYTIGCFGPSGSKTQGTGSNVAAGQTKKIYMNNTGCAANTNALEFIMNVPNGNVVGSFIRQHTTSGDTAADSLTGNSNGQTYPY